MKLYRLLTGDDSADFCHRVTEALSKDWELYGDPVYTFDEKRGAMRCAQAVVKVVPGEYDKKIKLGEM